MADTNTQKTQYLSRGCRCSECELQLHVALTLTQASTWGTHTKCASLPTPRPLSLCISLAKGQKRYAGHINGRRQRKKNSVCHSAGGNLLVQSDLLHQPSGCKAKRVSLACAVVTHSNIRLCALFFAAALFYQVLSDSYFSQPSTAGNINPADASRSPRKGFSVLVFGFVIANSRFQEFFYCIAAAAAAPAVSGRCERPNADIICFVLPSFFCNRWNAITMKGVMMKHTNHCLSFLTRLP